MHSISSSWLYIKVLNTSKCSINLWKTPLMNKLLSGVLNAILSSWWFRMSSICSAVFLSNFYLDQLSNMNAVGDHVKCFAKIKIHSIHFSAFIHQTSQKTMGVIKNNLLLVNLCCLSSSLFTVCFVLHVLGIFFHEDLFINFHSDWCDANWPAVSWIFFFTLCIDGCSLFSRVIQDSLWTL